jgi:hypothetical protein
MLRTAAIATTPCGCWLVDAAAQVDPSHAAWRAGDSALARPVRKACRQPFSLSQPGIAARTPRSRHRTDERTREPR